MTVIKIFSFEASSSISGPNALLSIMAMLPPSPQRMTSFKFAGVEHGGWNGCVGSGNDPGECHRICAPRHCMAGGMRKPKSQRSHRLNLWAVPIGVFAQP